MNPKNSSMQLAALAVGVGLLAVLAISSFGTAKQATTMTTTTTTATEIQSDSEWMSLKLQEAFAASQGIYLSYPPIKGESTTPGFVGQIEILSFQFGSGRPTSYDPTSKGMRVGSPSISEITLTKLSDSATPLIFEASLVGKAVPLVTMSFVKTNDKGALETYMQVKLSNAMITSYSVSSGGDVPTESISLSFTKIEMAWLQALSDGKTGTLVTRTYDLTAAATA